MATTKKADLKSWAADLICKQGMSQKEAASIVGVSVVTMNKWYKAENWEALRRSCSQPARLNSTGCTCSSTN